MSKVSEDILRGKKTELDFIEVYRHMYPKYEISQADEWDDRINGIDIWMNGKGVQVKALKYQRKVLYIPQHIPLEFKNVSGGTGSLFKNSELYVFEFKKYFMMFNTSDLQVIFNIKVNFDIEPIPSLTKGFWNPITGYPLYTLITRCEFPNIHTGKPNEDEFAYLHANDLMEIPRSKFLKLL